MCALLLLLRLLLLLLVFTVFTALLLLLVERADKYTAIAPDLQEQWAHLNPTAWGAFLTGRLSRPAGCIKQGRSLQGLGREEACRAWEYSLASWQDNTGKKLAAKIKNQQATKYLLCSAFARDASFAYL